MNNGTVLIAGGQDNSGDIFASAEVYDPVAMTCSIAGNMSIPRVYDTASLLTNGTVFLLADRVQARALLQLQKCSPRIR